MDPIADRLRVFRFVMYMAILKGILSKNPSCPYSPATEVTSTVVKITKLYCEGR